MLIYLISEIVELLPPIESTKIKVGGIEGTG